MWRRGGGSEMQRRVPACWVVLGGVGQRCRCDCMQECTGGAYAQGHLGVGHAQGAGGGRSCRHGLLVWRQVWPARVEAGTAR